MNNKLCIPTAEGLYFFSPDDIIRLEACSNYTDLYFTNRKPLRIAKVLKELGSVLEPFGFLRTHRSHLVNRRFISHVYASGIVMQDSSTAEISRRKKRVIIQTLKTAI